MRPTARPFPELGSKILEPGLDLFDQNLPQDFPVLFIGRASMTGGLRSRRAIKSSSRSVMVRRLGMAGFVDGDGAIHNREREKQHHAAFAAPTAGSVSRAPICMIPS
jgi:hypothetical protein